MVKESRIEIRIAEDLKERGQVEAVSLGYNFSEYVSFLICKNIEQRDEEVDLEAQRYFADMREWSTRSGKPVSELIDRIENLAKPPPPTKRTAYEVALELEKRGVKQKDIARILNQGGYTYPPDGQPFTYQRVWHLLNPNGFSERKDRLGLS